MSTSVVIPAFNESQRITPTIKDIFSYFSNKQIEVVVVDDGSTDTTASVLKELAQKYPCMKTVSYPNNKGKGYALQQGIKVATQDYILTLDADGSTPIDQYETLMKLLVSNHLDFVIGSRHIEGSLIESKQPFYRVIISRLGNAIIRWTLIPNIHDTQCGFKLYKKETAKKLFEEIIIYGFGNDVEILYKAQKLSLSFRECPVTWFNSPNSTLRPIRASLKTALAIFKIHLHYR